MIYIENIFVLIVAPLVACLFCVRGKPREVVIGLLVGMTACLASAYVSSFLALTLGIDSIRTAVEIAPTVEEIAKFLPLLFYLVVFQPEIEDVDLAFIMVAVGFASMESAFYLGESGFSDPGTLLLRGLSTAMMHVVCGVVVGYGLTRAWKHVWLRAAGTFGLLCLASTYHGVFNLLIAAGGYAQIFAIVLPVATLVPLLAARRHREKSEQREKSE